MTVRTATPDDAEAVADLVHTAYRSEESRHGWTTEADLVGGRRADTDMVRELATSEHGVVLVGLSDGGADPTAGPSVVACCHLERRGTAAYLGMFAVHPRRQGQGIGHRMLAAAETYAATTWGSTMLEITVLNHRPELVAWYERSGFELTGARHDFPHDEERFGIPRRDDLELLSMARPVPPTAP